MTNKERVLAALHHESSDKVPFDIGFTQKAHAKMVDYYGDPHFTRKLDTFLVGLGTEPDNSWRETAPDVWQDQFGVQWDRSIDKDIGVVCNCLVTPETLDEYQFPDPHDPSRYAQYESVLEAHADKFVYASIGFSLFERAWTLAGMETVLMAMINDKPFLHELLDRILDFNLQVIDNACRYPIDAMMFGDDWGQQTGLIMGPTLWREFFRPRLAQMYGRVRKKGKYVMIHSCGKVDELFPDLIEIGLNVFNPFQPEVIDVYKAKKTYGDRLTFYGGISTQRTLPYATPDEVKAEVRQLLAAIGRDGGYIAAPAHSIPGDARPENVAAMIEALHEQ